MLTLLEGLAVAICHAAQSHLDSLDDLQRHFLKEIAITEWDASLGFNLAPLQLRRDFPVLGLLHKIQLGLAHPGFGSLFPDPTEGHSYATRRNAQRHERQFFQFTGNALYFNWSVFGVVKIHNTLHADIVSASTVKAFQSLLTKDARAGCKAGCPH